MAKGKKKMLTDSEIAARRPMLNDAYITRRETLLEDSGLRFSEAGLTQLDQLAWQDLKGLIEDQVEQSREFDRLVARDA